MSEYRHPEFLISASELAGQIGDPDLVVLDVTTTLVPNNLGTFELVTGSAVFNQGHIPGAQYVDLERDLSRPLQGRLFTLPDCQHFAAAANAIGIGAQSRVVVYSTAQPGWAARVWLMLRAFGFEKAAVLDGGFNAWKAGGHPVESGLSTFSRAPDLEPFAWKDNTARFFADTQMVEAAVAERSSQLVNALGRDYFRGEGDIAYGRKGHIPGSANVPTSELTRSDGRYREAAAMETLFASEGVTPDKPVVSYCGAGVAASNVTFARLLLGYEDSRVYDGSLMEWTSDPTRPMIP